MEELMKDMKKRSIGNVWWVSLILLLVAGGLLVINGPATFQIFSMLTGGRNLNSIPSSELYNAMAVCEVNMVYDCFAEYESENGKIYDYYIIPYREEEFIAVRVDESRASEMDGICDDTWEYLMGNSGMHDRTISLKGNVRPMDGDELYYYKDWFTSVGYSGDEMKAYAVNSVLEDGKFAKGASPRQVYLITAVSLLFIIWAAWLLIKACTGGYLKAIRKDLEQLGSLSESQIVSDYQNAYVINKDVRIGRIFTYNAVPTSPRAYLNKNMAWAYLYRTKNYTNGLYTGSSYNVMIYPANGTEQMGDIAIKKKYSDMILEYYANNFPHMVVGYSDELKRLYHSDRNAFLALRYLPAQDTLNY